MASSMWLTICYAIRQNGSEVAQIKFLVFCIQRVSIKMQQLLQFFLRNWHKSLVRVLNNIIEINSIFHKIFVVCNLDLGSQSYSKSCKVSMNIFGLVMKGPAIDHILLFSSWKITILQSIFTVYDVRVQSKIWYYDPIEWQWANNACYCIWQPSSGLYAGPAVRMKSMFTCVLALLGLPQCPRFLLRLMQHVKYLLTFLITVCLSGVAKYFYVVYICIGAS